VSLYGDPTAKALQYEGNSCKQHYCKDDAFDKLWLTTWLTEFLTDWLHVVEWFLRTNSFTSAQIFPHFPELGVLRMTVFARFHHCTLSRGRWILSILLRPIHLRSVLIRKIEANMLDSFSTLFDMQIYMFRTHLLSSGVLILCAQQVVFAIQLCWLSASEVENSRYIYILSSIHTISDMPHTTCHHRWCNHSNNWKD